MYTPVTLWEDPTRLFMESDNYQPRLVLKDIKSNINDFSILFEESTKYEVKVETFTLACGHRQWNKNTTEGSTTHIKSKKAAI